MKRIFDIVFSFFGLVILSPLFILLSIWIMIDSKGGVFYFQKRVGKDKILFNLFKFRTMVSGADKKGLITVGERDSRITGAGYFMRKFKLDELPQLFNVFIGDMSIVGPRPEVPKYVEMYSETQLKVLNVRPGLTDIASLEYFDENALLAESKNPDATYIKEIMPAKLRLNLQYIEERNFIFDVKLIIRTIGKIFRKR